MSDYYYSQDDHAIIANGDTLTVEDAKKFKIRLEDKLVELGDKITELEEAIDEYNRRCPDYCAAYHESLER